MSTRTNRPVLLLAAVILLALAIVGGIAVRLAFVTGGEATVNALRPLEQRVAVAAALDADTFIVGTTSNELVVWQDGQQASQSLPSLASAITVLPDNQFAVGMVTGELQIYSRDLQPGLGWKLPGRITGLATSLEGDLIVTFGSGQSANDFQVQRFDTVGTHLSSALVGLPTRGIASFRGLAIFINIRGNVGAVDADGQVAWTSATPQALNVVAADAAGSALYVGDQRGTVTRMDADGNLLWSQTITEYELDSLYALPEEAGVVVGARDGSIFALDGDGQLQFSQRPADSSVRALLPAQNGNLIGLANNGAQFSLNVATLQFAPVRETWQSVSNVIIGALLVTSAVLGFVGWGRTAQASSKLARRMYRARLAYIFIAPAMLLMIIFTYYPTIMAFYVSFTNFNLSGPMEFIGLRNFENMLRDTYLIAGVKNMIILLIANVIKVLTVPLLVAELIFWIRSEVLKYWFRTAFVLPAIVPGIVAILLWKTIWAPNIGLVNQTLQLLGLGEFQRAWLGEDTTALLAVILTGFPWVDIFAFLVFYGGLLTINSEIFDAAAVDGANVFRRFISIDLPGLRPQIMLVLFFAFVGSIQGFEGIYVLTGGGPGTATSVPALEMFLKISRTAQFGYASAIGLVLTVIIGVLVFLRFRLIPSRVDQ